MNRIKLLKTMPGKISLQGVLSFETVNHALESMPVLFEGEVSLLIDLSGVEKTDSAGLALLVEWMGLAKRKNIRLCYSNIPSQLLATARVSGLDEVLPIELD